jgi:hypothetical protein
MIEVVVATIGALAVVSSAWLTSRKTRRVVRQTRAEDSAEHDRVTELIRTVHSDVLHTNKMLFQHVSDRAAHPSLPIVERPEGVKV